MESGCRIGGSQNLGPGFIGLKWYSRPLKVHIFAILATDVRDGFLSDAGHCRQTQITSCHFLRNRNLISLHAVIIKIAAKFTELAHVQSFLDVKVSSLAQNDFLPDELPRS